MVSLTFANQYLFDKRAGLTLTTLRQVKFSLFLFLWLPFAVQIILITSLSLYCGVCMPGTGTLSTLHVLLVKIG